MYHQMMLQLCLDSPRWSKCISMLMMNLDVLDVYQCLNCALLNLNDLHVYVPIIEVNMFLQFYSFFKLSSRILRRNEHKNILEWQNIFFQKQFHLSRGILFYVTPFTCRVKSICPVYASQNESTWHAIVKPKA